MAHVNAVAHTIRNEAIPTTAHADTNFDKIIAAAIQGKLQSNLFMLVNVLTTCKAIIDDLITCFGQTITLLDKVAPPTHKS